MSNVNVTLEERIIRICKARIDPAGAREIVVALVRRFGVFGIFSGAKVGHRAECILNGPGPYSGRESASDVYMRGSGAQTKGHAKGFLTRADRSRPGVHDGRVIKVAIIDVESEAWPQGEES